MSTETRVARNMRRSPGGCSKAMSSTGIGRAFQWSGSAVRRALALMAWLTAFAPCFRVHPLPCSLYNLRAGGKKRRGEGREG